MKNIISVEDAYHAIAQEILCFVSTRNWESAGGIYQILRSSTAKRWFVVSHGVKTRKGDLPPLEARSIAGDALFFLRDDLLKTTGQRIWGLTFNLYPDGKFNIAYDYNKPEDYEETDETVDLSQVLEGLQKQGVKILRK